MKIQIMKKQSMRKQMGMTMVSWMVLLVFIGFQLMIVAKIVPVFAEDQTIDTIWQSLDNDADLVGLSPKKIKKAITRKMRLNNIYDFDMSTIKVKKSKGYHIITVEYEPRGTIVGPLDFIVSFKHEARVKVR